jgi:hypothetical protein
MPYLIHHYRLPLAFLSRMPGPPSTDVWSLAPAASSASADFCRETTPPSGIATHLDLAFLLLAGWGGTMDKQAAPHW